MNTNKIILIGSVIVIMCIISVPTIYKVIKNHENNLYQVTEKKIISAAKECYYDEKCQNPISKEYYNEMSYIIR